MAVRWIEAGDLTNPTAADADSAALAASWILYKLSGEKYPGVSRSTDWYGTDVDYLDYSAYTSEFRHVNVFEVKDYTTKRLRLRSQPVQRVESVYAGAEELAPSDYVIGNRSYLARTNGRVWDMARGVTVTYLHGVEPPEPGIRAAQRLADELVLSVTNPEACVLPDRVTSVSRQGISYTILDAQDFLENGRTGIYEIDLFLKTANPIGARKRPKVYSPDLPSGRRAR